MGSIRSRYMTLHVLADLCMLNVTTAIITRHRLHMYVNCHPCADDAFNTLRTRSCTTSNLARAYSPAPTHAASDVGLRQMCIDVDS
jgi:hypothetical protein